LKVAVIGAGMIGGAIVEALLRRGFEVTATRRRVEKIAHLKRMGVEVTSDNREAARKADVVIISVKPKDVRGVLEEIKGEISGKLVISVAAAVSLNLLRDVAPEARYVRAMPNLAVLVGESMTAYSTDPRITRGDEEKAKAVLEALGKAVRVEEGFMDAITALSGCAPAYLSIILEALTYAGLEVGLPREVALTSAAQSMVGTGKLILEADKKPEEIREIVATPGGVTIEGLKELESIPIRYAFMRAIRSATAKSKKISRELAEM